MENNDLDLFIVKNFLMFTGCKFLITLQLDHIIKQIFFKP